MQSQGSGCNIKRVTHRQGRTRQNHGAVSEQAVTQLQANAQRSDIQGRRVGIGSSHVAAVLPTTLTRNPQNVLLARSLQNAAAHIVHLRDTRARHLQAGVNVLTVRFGIGQGGAGGIIYRRNSGQKATVQALQKALGKTLESGLQGASSHFQRAGISLRMLLHATCRTANHRNRQRTRHGTGHTVHQFMSLINNDRLMFGQNLHAFKSVNRQQGVVRDDNVSLSGTATRHLAKALFHQRAAAAQTLGGTDRHLSPGAVRDAGLQLVTVAGLREVSPLAQAHHFLTHAGSRRRHVKESIRLVFRVAALQLVQAEVVIAALEQSHLRLRLRARLQRL